MTIDTATLKRNRSSAKRPAGPSAAERILDRAIELTFPASDPVAVEHAFRSARARDQASAKARPMRRAKQRRQEP